MKGIYTINTDAGFRHETKIGSYAYWIKGDGVFLRGSGIFKGTCNGPHEAETKAIINALHILISTGRKDIVRIIFNRDCKTAMPKENGNTFQKMLAKLLADFKNDCGKKHPDFYEFRHVKGHQRVITDKRSWVNTWLDAECTRQLRAYRREQVVYKNEKDESKCLEKST